MEVMMKVLVLDMSPLARRLIHEELVFANYTVLEAESPEHAFGILASEPDIGLVTTAVALDDSDGFDFIQKLRSGKTKKELEPLNNHDVPVIVVTGNDTDADRLKGFRVGAADFILKPWQRGQLARHVDSVVGHDDELQGMSVLVVDDSKSTRNFIRSCLTRLGVTIHEADDGYTALEFLRENTVDLLLTDLMMKSMDGDALCLKVREELGLHDLPIIFLSGNDNRDTIISLFRLGATDYLNKPFLQEELMTRLKVHLQRERLVRTLRDVADIKATGQQIVLGPDPESQVTIIEGDRPRPPRILLVDDSPVNLAVGSKLMQRLGCEVEAVQDGEMALTCYDERLDASPYDLVLMDLVMPQLGGIEVAKGIRELEQGLPEDHPVRQNPVPIIALSACDADEKRDECLEAGMSDYQQKPLKMEAIEETMRFWLPSQDPVSSFQ
jgi:CheY-like chemotaxis protein